MAFKSYQVYILTNKRHTVLYTGVTNNILRRVAEHQQKIYSNSFTARYNCNKLVWFENYYDPVEAIAREKQIKAGSRRKKEALINALNPEWQDLACDLTD